MKIKWFAIALVWLILIGALAFFRGFVYVPDLDKWPKIMVGLISGLFVSYMFGLAIENRKDLILLNIICAGIIFALVANVFFGGIISFATTVLTAIFFFGTGATIILHANGMNWRRLFVILKLPDKV